MEPTASSSGVENAPLEQNTNQQRIADIKKTISFLAHKENTEVRIIDVNQQHGIGMVHTKHLPPSEISDFVANYDGKYNIYVGINERKKNGTTAKEVISVKTIVIDIDPTRERGAASSEAELQKATQLARDISSSFENEGYHKPSLLMSGNGVQLWFSIPEVKLTDDNREKIENKIKLFHRAIIKQHSTTHVHIDNIGDLPRIIKLGGTMSVKGAPSQERPHRRSYWIEYYGRTEDKKLWETILMLEEPEKKKLEVPTDVEVMKTGELFLLRKKDKKLDRLMRGDMEGFNSRSDAEMSLVCKLVYYNFTKEQIGKIFTKYDPFGKWGERNDSYRELTIDKAFDFQEERAEVKIDFNQVAKDILKKHCFLTIKDTDEILHYNGGFYHSNGDKKIREVAKRITFEKIKTHLINEILLQIKTETYIEREELDPNKNTIPLKNGAYNINEKTFIEKTPALYNTYQHPFEYNPEATCPLFMKFLGEVVEEYHALVLQEMAGYCLLKDYPFQKSFMLTGIGQNGKSVFLAVLKHLLGAQAVSSKSLQELEENRFAKAELFGKLANIHPDLSDDALKQTGSFKALCGGDMIMAERKFGQPFSFNNYAKMIFSANKLPQSSDNSDAFFRRWVIIPFPNVIKNPDANLTSKLVTQEELSGIFNWALVGLYRLLDNKGFTNTKNTDDMRAEYTRLSDSLQAFVDDRCIEDIDGVVDKDAFYAAYADYCREHKVFMKTNNIVGRELPKIGRIIPSRARVNGAQTTVWKGILLKPQDTIPAQKNNDVYTQGVQGVQGSSLFKVGNFRINGNNMEVVGVNNENSLSLGKEKPYSPYSLNTQTYVAKTDIPTWRGMDGRVFPKIGRGQNPAQLGIPPEEIAFLFEEGLLEVVV